MAEGPATALARLVNISTHTGSVLCCFAVLLLYELLYTSSSVIHPTLSLTRGTASVSAPLGTAAA